ncbi:MAG: insulinase family protein [Candidatus Nanopelagicales bacterium]|jgi:predicted Zn-dependent peptidase|nr:insulinase family protein [Candidatus Nanopelagicales bacterium]MDP4746791.1 insulinase family protein [Candidatus Nanopelagicales bacterium]MDP4986018.1 insulinase family protein [Candidatus Nanopelagicales bacterium]
MDRFPTQTLEDTGKGGIVQQTILPSGLKIITETVPTVRSAAVGYWVATGSRDEEIPEAGAAHFLEHLLFKGTPTRTAMEISSSLEAVGGDMNAFTTQEYTCFHAKVLDRDMKLVIDTLSDMLTSSNVTNEDVDQERNVVLEEISMHEDEPNELAYDNWSQTLLGDQPIGRPIIGTRKSITEMTRTQVYGFFKKYYSPERTIISIAGNIDHDVAVKMIVDSLKGTDWDKSGVKPLEPRTSKPLPTVGSGIKIVKKDTEQAHIVWGVPGLDRHDEKRYIIAVLSAAVGGGMSSRLFQEIREKRGLVYTVYSFAHHYTGTGIFGVYAGTTKEKVNEVVEIIKKELADVAANGITEEELERGKGALRGGLVLGLEETNARMTRIAKGELLYGEYMSLDDTLSKIDAVSVEDIKALAAQLFTQKALLCVVGSFNDQDQFKDLVV